MTRALVAARARYASTKTMGNIALRLFGVALDPGQTTDRVLCGPTNEVWMIPGSIASTKPGRSPDGKTKGTGTIERGMTLTEIGLTDRRVTHVMVERTSEAGTSAAENRYRGGRPFRVRAARRGAVGAREEDPRSSREHPQFKNVITIAGAEGREQCLRKMTGLQIYCKKALMLGAGSAPQQGAPAPARQSLGAHLDRSGPVLGSACPRAWATSCRSTSRAGT